MSTLSTGELAAIVGGRLRLGSMPPLGGDLEPIGRLSIDSRAVTQGDVFWGLAVHPDAANLPEEAYARGALGVVVSGRRVTPWAGTFSIEVDDPKWALWQLGRTMRRRFDGQVIAVAGDLGKTMTRSMIDTVLSDRFVGAAGDDVGRHQDHMRVGLPLLLSELNDDEHDYAVVELHGKRPAELAAQIQLCQPNILVVTPFAECDVAARDTRREMLAELPDDCLVIADGDDPRWGRHAELIHSNLMWVGRGADCDLAAEFVRLVGGQLQLSLDGSPVRVPVWGRHHLQSVLAATAVGRLMGLSTRDIASTLTGFAPPSGRCSVAHGGGLTVVDDSGCSSATAAGAVLHALRDAARNGRRLLVLGELPNAEAPETYRRLGALAVGQCGADALIACGRGADAAVAAAREAGMPADSAVACPTDQEEVAARVAAMAGPGDTVLVVGGPQPRMHAIAKQITSQQIAAQQVIAAAARPVRSARTTANPHSPHHSFEVPPLASALREAGAALPPGSEH